MGRIGGIAIAVAAGLMLAAPAFACMPMPPPPMPAPAAGTSAADVAALELAWGQSYAASRALEDRDWQVKQQARLFDEATRVVIVRYDREEKTRGMPKEFAYMNGQPQVVVKPLRWVKGEADAGELRIGMGEAPPCGQMRAQDAFNGKPGDVFLVYLAGTKAQPEMMQALKLDRIIEPRTLAALNAR